MVNMGNAARIAGPNAIPRDPRRYATTVATARTTNSSNTFMTGLRPRG